MIGESDYQTENHGIYWQRNSAELTVDMSWRQFQELDGAAVQLRGKSLYQLAEENPMATYKLFKKMIGSVARQSAFNSIVVGESKISFTKSEDDVGEARAFTERLLERWPDETDEFAFKLRAYPSEEDIVMLGADPGDITTLIEADVKPTNLAF